MPEPTPAQRQAEFLTALAEHLRAHPQLAEVVLTDRGRAQVTVAGNPDGSVSRAFTRWARSIGVDTVQARRLSGTKPPGAVVTAAGTVGAHGFEVCAVIDGLVLPYDWTRKATDAVEFAVADLEYFTEHGTLPEAGGSGA